MSCDHILRSSFLGGKDSTGCAAPGPSGVRLKHPSVLACQPLPFAKGQTRRLRGEGHRQGEDASAVQHPGRGQEAEDTSTATRNRVCSCSGVASWLSMRSAAGAGSSNGECSPHPAPAARIGLRFVLPVGLCRYAHATPSLPFLSTFSYFSFSFFSFRLLFLLLRPRQQHPCRQQRRPEQR